MFFIKINISKFFMRLPWVISSFHLQHFASNAIMNIYKRKHPLQSGCLPNWFICLYRHRLSCVENATDYKDNLTYLIKDVRKKFTSYAGDNGIAFVDAYIADNPNYWVYCDLVNESKRQVAELSWTNVLIDTIAEGLTCSEEPEENPDMAHYDSMSQIKLGHLFAENVSQFFD